MPWVAPATVIQWSRDSAFDPVVGLVEGALDERLNEPGLGIAHGVGRRAQHLGVRRGLHGLVAKEDFFVELFAGAHAAEGDVDVHAFFEPTQPNEVAGADCAYGMRTST